MFRRLDGSSAEIEAGPLRMKIAVEEIVGVESMKPISPAGAASSGITVRTTSEESTADEINLIGSTVEEATERVDKFLDQAALARKARIRIIHGHGTGALRKGLAEFLKSQPLVAR